MRDGISFCSKLRNSHFENHDSTLDYSLILCTPYALVTYFCLMPITHMGNLLEELCSVSVDHGNKVIGTSSDGDFCFYIQPKFSKL